MTMNPVDDNRRSPLEEDSNTRAPYSRANKISTTSTQLSPERLPPEPQEGFIEYKRQFVPRDEARRERLETQLRFRLDEGQGSAVYELGVEDDGSCHGISVALLDESEAELKAMAMACDAQVTQVTRLKCAQVKGSSGQGAVLPLKCTSTGNGVGLGKQRQQGQDHEGSSEGGSFGGGGGGGGHVPSAATAGAGATTGKAVVVKVVPPFVRWRSTVEIRRNKVSEEERQRTSVAPKLSSATASPASVAQFSASSSPLLLPTPSSASLPVKALKTSSPQNKTSKDKKRRAVAAAAATGSAESLAASSSTSSAAVVSRCSKEVQNGTAAAAKAGVDDGGNAVDEDEDDEAELRMQDLFSTEVRIAVCGNVDAGKSTCVGVLVKHKLDDGRGAVRSHVMRYPHEIETGRTSAVVHHTITERVDGSGRRVTLVDLAGHEKYLRTTIYGFNSGLIDVALVLVNARKGPLGTTRHHLELAANLHTPVVVCVSKVDGCPPDVLAQTGRDLAKLLKQLFPNAQIKPMRRLLPSMSPQTANGNGGGNGGGGGAGVESSPPSSSTTTMPTSMPEGPSTEKLEEVGRAMPDVIPILPVSFVTGEGVVRLRRFVFALSARTNYAMHAQCPLEFVADGVYTPPGVGPVLSGFVLRGTAKVGQAVHIGPRPDGTFILGSVRSIHVDRALIPEAPAGASCCLAVSVAKKDDRRFLRRGMAVLSPPTAATAAAGGGGGTAAAAAAAVLTLPSSIPPLPPHMSGGPHMGRWEFDARLFVVRGSSATLRVGYQPYAHIVMVRQTVAIVSVRVERSKTKHHRLLDDEDDDEAGNKSDGDSGGLTGDEVEGGAAAARSAGEGDNGGLSGPMEALALEGGAGAGHSKAAAAAAAAAKLDSGGVLLSAGGDDEGGDEADAEGLMRRHAPSVQARRNQAKDAQRRQQVMHSGQVGVVRFRFLVRPEFVRPGMRVMLREGKMRSVGEVIA